MFRSRNQIDSQPTWIIRAPAEGSQPGGGTVSREWADHLRIEGNRRLEGHDVGNRYSADVDCAYSKISSAPW